MWNAILAAGDTVHVALSRRALLVMLALYVVVAGFVVTGLVFGVTTVWLVCVLIMMAVGVLIGLCMLRPDPESRAIIARWTGRA